MISDFNVLAPSNNDTNGIVKVKLKKSKVTIRCPKYLRVAILVNSKMLMLDFVYNCLVVTFNSNEYDIFYTDTDSIYLRMKKETVVDYESFLQYFDSNLKQLHFATPNDITLELMKLEKKLTKAIFLKLILYSYIDIKQKQEIKTKGVWIKQNKEVLIFDNYTKSLFLNTSFQVKN